MIQPRRSRGPRRGLVLVGVLAASLAGAAPWPGESFTSAVDLTPLVPGTATGFGQQLSDLHWNPLTRTLWVARAPGGVWALNEAGDGGFRVTAKYAAINSDYEGITQADLSEAAVFVLDETGGFIRKYAVDAVGGATLLRTWDLAGVVPGQVGNAGPEGLAFVPDDALRAAGFPASAFDGGGLFFVAHQNGGHLYAVDLDPANNAGRTLIARLATSRVESSGVAFDRSSGRLYISHNTGTNFLEVARLAAQADGGLSLQRVVELDSPNASNLEGFAVTAQYSADGGAPAERWCFWADDDGNSLGRPGLMWFRQLPPALTIAAGDGQAAAASSGVPISPAVTLRDAFSNQYLGQRVAFGVTAGGGSVIGSPALTSAVGLGVVGGWTLGPSGTQQLTATASDFTPAPSVAFSATVLPSDGGGLDAGTGTDAGSSADAGAGTDAGPATDAGAASDAGSTDAGQEPITPGSGCGCDATGSSLAQLALLLLAAMRARRRCRADGA